MKEMAQLHSMQVFFLQSSLQKLKQEALYEVGDRTSVNGVPQKEYIENLKLLRVFSPHYN